MRGFKEVENADIFSRFDPYLSFADDQLGVELHSFVTADHNVILTPPELWRLGREAYRELSSHFDFQLQREQFEHLAIHILQRESSETWINFVEEFIADERNSLQVDIDAPLIKDVRQHLSSENYCEGWLINAIAHISRKLSDHYPTPDELNEELEVLLWASSFLWINSALIELEQGPLASLAYSCIYRSATEAKVFSEALIAKRSSVSAVNRKSAKIRHASSDVDKENFLQEWRKDRNEYHGAADFCRIIKKKNNLTYSLRTLEYWIREDKKN